LEQSLSFSILKRVNNIYFTKYIFGDNKCTMMCSIGGIDWRNFDDNDCSDGPSGSFGGKASFTWFWPGEDDDLGNTPNGFQWRDEPRSTKSRGRVWNESDVDEEEQPCRDDLKSHRLSLGLPASGPLKLDHIKSA
jgi:hypothetical protein